MRALPVLLAALLPGTAHAAFQDASLSVPAKALGGAFAAGMDPSSLFLNPAGLAGLEQPEAAVMYGRPFAGLPGIGLNQAYGAVVWPTQRGTLAAGATLFDGAGLVREQQAVLGYARSQGQLRFGAGLTYMRRSFPVSEGSNDPVFERGDSKGALGLDLGLQALVAEGVALGASARRLNEPEVGIHDADQAPAEYRTGGALRMGRMVLLADAVYNQEWSFHGGVAIPTTGATFRLGTNSYEFLTAGVGLNLGQMTVDYAMALASQVPDNGGTHQLAVSYRFGHPLPEKRVKGVYKR